MDADYVKRQRAQFDALKQTLTDAYRSHAGDLGMAFKEALPDFLVYMADEDAALRKIVCQLMWEVALKTGMASELIDAIRNGNPGLHALTPTVMKDIGKLAEPAVPLFAALLKDPEQNMRLVAVASLAGLGDVAKSALPELKRATRDKNLYVRYPAKQAVKKLTSSSGTPTPRPPPDRSACSPVRRSGPAARRAPRPGG